MDAREGLGGGRGNETVPDCDHWMWPNVTGTCTAQPGWCGHKLHHLSPSGLMQPHFLSSCGIEKERAEQRDQHDCWVLDEQLPEDSKGILFQPSGLGRAAKHRREFRAGHPCCHVWDN